MGQLGRVYGNLIIPVWKRVQPLANLGAAWLWPMRAAAITKAMAVYFILSWMLAKMTFSALKYIWT